MTTSIYDLPESMQTKIVPVNDCWEWVGSTNAKGYGSVADGSGGTMLAHRKAYELLVGPIPAGLTLDHLCMRTVCVRPSHLEPVDNAENQRRRAAARTHCAKGHPMSGANLRLHKRKTRVARECRACDLERSRSSYARAKSTPVRPKERPVFNALIESFANAAA
jgi:hypothetical protein